MTDWYALIAVEGIPTVDGRLIRPGGLTWGADSPLPLMVTPGPTWSHVGARPVGAFHPRDIIRHGPWVLASGWYLRDGAVERYHAAEVREFAAQVAAAAAAGDPLGIGIDLGIDPGDDISVSDGDRLELSGRVLAATVYPRDSNSPAFPQCRIVPTGSFGD